MISRYHPSIGMISLTSMRMDLAPLLLMMKESGGIHTVAYLDIADHWFNRWLVPTKSEDRDDDCGWSGSEETRDELCWCDQGFSYLAVRRSDRAISCWCFRVDPCRGCRIHPVLDGYVSIQHVSRGLLWSRECMDSATRSGSFMCDFKKVLSGLSKTNNVDFIFIPFGLCWALWWLPDQVYHCLLVRLMRDHGTNLSTNMLISAGLRSPRPESVQI